MNQKGEEKTKIIDVFKDYFVTTGAGLNLGLSILKFWSKKNFNSMDSLLYPLQQIVDKNGKILDNAGLKDELNHFYNSVDKLEEEINKTFKSTINAMSGISLDISELDNNNDATKNRKAPGVGQGVHADSETKNLESRLENLGPALPAVPTHKILLSNKDNFSEKVPKKKALALASSSNTKKKGGRRRTLKKALKKRNGRKLSKIRFN